MPCTIVVPVGNNPEKNAAMRAFGAEVVECGRDFDESREEVERRVTASGGRLRYVHSANEPLLIAGVATYALEIFEALPDAEVVFVPVGGGSGAAGLVTVRDALACARRIVGVQAERRRCVRTVLAGPQRVVGERADTFAEGLATRVTFDLTFAILAHGLDDVVTLSEEELREGVRLALRATHNLAEGAGVAALMAAARRRDRPGRAEGRVRHERRKPGSGDPPSHRCRHNHRTCRCGAAAIVGRDTAERCKLAVIWLAFRPSRRRIAPRSDLARQHS